MSKDLYACYHGGCPNEMWSTTITAPQDGVLIMGGGFRLGTSAKYPSMPVIQSSFRCWLAVDGVAVEGTSRAAVLEPTGVDHGGKTMGYCSVTGAHAVSAGEHTVSLAFGSGGMGAGIEGPNGVSGHTIWAMFVPNSG
jgi:hypothetical protein